MPRRLLVLPAGLGLGLLSCRRLRRRTRRRPGPGCRQAGRCTSDPATVPLRRECHRAAAKVADTVRPGRRSRPLEISPGSLTITADDPGLQLLAARNEAGSTRDLTAEVKWSARAAGSGRDRAGRLSPARRAGEVTVRAAFEGQTASRKITLEPRSNRSWDFAQDIVPVLTRLGLQHRQLPRQGRRPERLSSLALRLRPRRRFPGPGARRRPAPALEAGSRREPVPRQGDRAGRPRRRSAAEGRLAGIPDPAGLGRDGAPERAAKATGPWSR